MIQPAIEKLIARRDLGREETAAVMRDIASGAATAAQMAAFLVALHAKGETAEELTGAAEVMRAHVDRVTVEGDGFIDTCGTGGDGRGTFNISTASAFVAAGAGAVVAKHGNRSVSSRCGSADVLAALGVKVDAPKTVIERCLREAGIGFLFAPRLHPAFAAVATVRRELGVRTVFNLLGPLANPAGARRQLLGVFDPRFVPLVAQTLRELGATHALVVHGDGTDELALTGETRVCEVNGAMTEYRVCPEDVGLQRCAPAALLGGDAVRNAGILRAVLDGEPGAPRDAVRLNAGAALVAAGRAATLRDGIEQATVSIDSGAARRKLDALVRLSNEAAP